MRDFTKISPMIWHSDNFRGLPDDNARYLYIYYYCNGHQSSAGCYRLPDGYAMEDLAWTGERYRDAREILRSHGMIVFDPETSEVLIEHWFRHNPPMNEKHRKGTETLAAQIQSAVLREKTQSSLREAWGSRINSAKGRVLDLRHRYS
jgi:hypothetical protein